MMESHSRRHSNKRKRRARDLDLSESLSPKRRKKLKKSKSSNRSKSGKKKSKYVEKLNIAIEICDTLRVDNLLRRKAIRNHLRLKDIQRLLFKTLSVVDKAGGQENFLRFLQVQGVNPDYRNSSGDNLLHAAARQGTLTAVEILLERTDIDVDSRNACDGNTALHCALGADYISLALVAYLRMCGANRHLVNHDGIAPKHMNLDEILSEYYEEKRQERARSEAEILRRQEAQMASNSERDWREKIAKETGRADVESRYEYLNSFDSKEEKQERSGKPDNIHARARSSFFKRTDKPMGPSRPYKGPRNADGEFCWERDRSSKSSESDGQRANHAGDTGVYGSGDVQSCENMESRRDSDDERWATFWNSDHAHGTVRFEDIPWPSGPDDNILWIHPELPKTEVKAALKVGLLRWHSDKFTSKFSKLLQPENADRILTHVNVISQKINEWKSSFI
eukprot:243438_1